MHWCEIREDWMMKCFSLINSWTAQTVEIHRKPRPGFANVNSRLFVLLSHDACFYQTIYSVHYISTLGAL